MNAALPRNALWMVISRLGTQALTVIFTVFLARRLGVDGFGRFAFITTLIFIANAVTTFGTDMLLIREIAASNDLSRLGPALGLQLALSLGLIMLVWIFGDRILGADSPALRLYSLALVPLAFFSIFTTALRGLQRMAEYMVLNLAIAAAQLAVLALDGVGLEVLFGALLAVQVLAAVLAGAICLARIPNFRTAWGEGVLAARSVVGAAVPIGALTILAMAYQRLSIPMLTMLADPSQAGLFSAASRIVEALKILPAAVLTAVYPALASGLESRAAARYGRWLVTGAILAAVLLFMLSAPLTLWLYGRQYAPSIRVLRVLGWVLIPFVANTWLTVSLLAAKQEGAVGAALAASLLVMLVLSVWWIPLGGAVGSAYALLISESAQCLILASAAGFHATSSGEPHEFSQYP